MKIEQIGASAGYTFAYWSLDSTLDRFLWSIERLAELGYRQYALEILEPPHVAIYSPENIKLLLDKSRKTGVDLLQFHTLSLLHQSVQHDGGTPAVGRKAIRGRRGDRETIGHHRWCRSLPIGLRNG